MKYAGCMVQARRVLLCGVVLLLMFAASGRAEPEYRILVLFSYHKGNLWEDRIITGIENTFAEMAPEAELVIEYMDTKRKPPELMFPLLFDLYREKYDHDSFDALLAVDDNALTFLLMYRDKLFGKVPAVFCGINNLDDYDVDSFSKYTGVVENGDLEATVDVALELHPETTHIVIISDETPSSKAYLQIWDNIKHKYANNHEFIYLMNLSYDELLTELARIPETSIVLHNNFFRDRLGNIFSEKESYEFVSKNTHAPVYVSWDWCLGLGVVGGKAANGRLQGVKSSEMVIQALQGTPIREIPIIRESPNLYMFDYEQLKRFDIALSQLPPDSVIINKPESFYWKYKHYILFTVGLVLFLSAMVVVLVINSIHRRRAESELRAIVDNSLVGIIYLKGGRIIAKVNRTITDILGYEESELMGRSPEMLHISPDASRAFEERYYDKLANKELFHVEYQMRRKDGTLIWCLLSGKALMPPNLLRGVIWVVDDITERKSAEEALRRARAELEERVEERTHALKSTNEQLRLEMEEHKRTVDALRETERKYYRNLEAIFGCLPDAIVTVDKDLTIVEANKAFVDFIGVQRRGLRGRTLAEILGTMKEPFVYAVKQTLETGTPVKDHRARFNKDDRTEQVMVLNTAPFLDHEGAFAGVIIEIRDITRLVELERQFSERTSFRNIIGKSPKMQELYDTLENLSEFDVTVLILGESGTGKELAAEALHYGGPNKEGPFIKVNCSALSESLLESELFGHVRGAFTGAYKDKVGRFEAAQGGTVFLDEIGDISPKIQLKLLRFLETREFERVGETKTLKADVRVVAATNMNLQDKVKEGLFRDDLYYRLKVMVITMPPLRERTGDIKLLVEHFMSHFSRRLDKPITDITQEAMQILLSHPWPGNVRELKHAVEYACIVCSGDLIEPAHLPDDLRTDAEFDMPSVQGASAENEGRMKLDVDGVLAALNQAKWNKTRAAKILGISRRHLYRQLDKYNIQ